MSDAVDEPGEQPAAEPHQHRHDHRQIDPGPEVALGSGSPLTVPTCAKLMAIIAVAPTIEPERQVDAAGDDHLRDADGDDADDRDLQDHDLQPRRVDQKALVLQQPAQKFEDQRDDDQPGKDVELGRTEAPLIGTSTASVAAAPTLWAIIFRLRRAACESAPP